MFPIQFFNSQLATFKSFSYITIFLIANVNGWKRERKRRKRCKHEGRIAKELNYRILFLSRLRNRITKSYTPRRQIRLRRLYPLSRCPNFQKRVQDATSKAKASVERKSSQDGITRTLIFQIGKPRFPSAALQSSLPSPLPVSLFHLAKYILCPRPV